MNAKNVIIAIVFGVLFLIVGFAFGIIYQKGKVVLPSENTVRTTPPLVKDLSSRVIPSITAYGTVSKIDGKNLTITNQGDSMTVPVRDDAKIYSFVIENVPVKPGSKLTTPKSVSKQVDFKEIKVGNSVSVSIRILSNSKVEGFSVVVLPPPAKPTPTPAPK